MNDDEKKAISMAITANKAAWDMLVGELIKQCGFDPRKLGTHIRGVQAALHKDDRPDLAEALDEHLAIVDTWSGKI